MKNPRDDFPKPTKDSLSKRVGMKCSNPDCQKLTCGPNTDPQKVTNIGVAAHICAAAKGGPRYDESMTPAERKSEANGIWLCQTCSKLIDSDPAFYTKEVLQSWKKLAEEATRLELESNKSSQLKNHDEELIKFYVQCFDRPAFKDHISQEGKMEDFYKAIVDTSIALNTGILKDRNGAILKQSEGKSMIQNPGWRDKLDSISDKLTLLYKRLEIAQSNKTFMHNESGYYCFDDIELMYWFNNTRKDIIEILSSICKDIGINQPQFPNRRLKW